MLVQTKRFKTQEEENNLNAHLYPKDRSVIGTTAKLSRLCYVRYSASFKKDCFSPIKKKKVEHKRVPL